MKIPSLTFGRRLRCARRRLFFSLFLAFAGALVAENAMAQTPSTSSGPAARIGAEISSASRVPLAGSLLPMAESRFESGRVPAATQFHGVSIVFSRSAAQEADLKALIKAQQTPSSPQYHKWLTPDQFAGRFGMAQADLDTAVVWLEQQGFVVDRIGRGHDRIYFSGTVAQVESALATQLHYYTVNGEKHFAPSTALSLPSALAKVVVDVANLHNFRPRPMVHRIQRSTVHPDFTSGQTGNHFVSPGDEATIYDVNAAYNAGWNGAGQSIAIAGESFVQLSDIENFQTASGWSAPKDPTMVLVPSTGSDGVEFSGDEAESDLDLEWSSTMAPGATVFFVYTGGGGNANVYDSVAYAIGERIAPIVSLSYGGCEPDFSASGIQAIEAVLEQGVAQGQTILVASGDDGASGCYRDTSLSTQARAALAVSYPASSPNVTAVGGTEFNEGSGSYWNSTPGTDIISSAISYIPEMAWNEDGPTNGLGSTGGGVSAFFSKPDWQTGVPGIPADGARDLPDLSLDAAAGHDGLLFCSSDTSFWPQGQVASCNDGFRDATTGVVTEAGGTSFAAPSFAGMLAIINQRQNSTGMGLLNPTLYQLAANTAAYASAFHDIVVGDNKCDTGESTFCPYGPIGYAAGPGYDLATGLGSIDLNNLMTAMTAPTLAGSTVKLTLETAIPTTAAPVSIGVAVAAASGNSVPTGSVSMTVDGVVDPAPVNLTGGTATYSASLQGSGNHIVVANYAGDSAFAASTATLSVNTLPATTTNITATTTEPTAGQQDTFTFIVEPTTGLDHPLGTLSISVDGATVAASQPLSANSTVNYATSFTQHGQHAVSAAYSGSNSFSPSSSSMTFNVVTGTTLTVTPASPSPAVGASDSFTVAVTAAAGSTVPSGTLRVLIDGISLSPAPVLTSGSATFSTSFVSVGTHAVAVYYAGSSDFAPAKGSISISAIPAPIGTTIAVTADKSTPDIGSNVNFSITVTSASGTTQPSGAVSVTVDGNPASTSPSLVNGAATFTTSFATAGTHTVAASYGGDASFTSSSGSATVTVSTPSFTLSSATTTTTQGGTATSAITVTSTHGYSGSVAFTVTADPSLTHVCFTVPSATVAADATAISTLSISTNQTACPGASAAVMMDARTSLAYNGPEPSPSHAPRVPGELIAAAGLLIGLLGRRSRLFRNLAAIVVLVAFGMVLSACGGGNSDATPKGTYTLTVKGTDSATSTITSSTSVTLTVN